MIATAAVETAIGRALAFLQAAQLPSGDFPVYASTDPQMEKDCTLDPSIFPTALAAHSLSFCAEAAPLTARAHDFLLAEMGRGGLWRHWTRDHPQAGSLPPDLDDTSCASLVLRQAGRSVPDNRALLLANRDRQGRFLTWVVPRLRWNNAAPALRQLRHLPTLAMFFRLTSAKPGDVDACVNANTLLYLGRFPGEEKVIDWLLEMLREGRERQCDKWYENSFVVRYFLSRALAGRAGEAGPLILARTAGEAPSSSLDHALAAAALLDWNGDADRHIEALLAAQSPDGSWRRAALYHGGRTRLRSGGFAEPHPDTPHWGSEALSTALVVEALARWRNASEFSPPQTQSC
ncbi:MAG TPA: hypothetical protein VGB48_06190 [Allosphingosinicella sp.]|jgi:hypothetical protein